MNLKNLRSNREQTNGTTNVEGRVGMVDDYVGSEEASV